MATRTHKEDFNRAILHKVEKILENIDRGQRLEIRISAVIGCSPEIEYEVSEMVGVPITDLPLTDDSEDK